MDHRTVGMKNPSCCRELAFSGGSTVIAYSKGTFCCFIAVPTVTAFHINL